MDAIITIALAGLVTGVIVTALYVFAVYRVEFLNKNKKDDREY